MATTAIEGNTLSEEEAEKIVSGELKLPPTQQYLADELNNIIDAVNTLLKRLADKSQSSDITIELLQEMNSMVLRDLEVDDGVIPGEFREHAVVVGRYRCPPWTDSKFLLKKLCDILNTFPMPENSVMQFCLLKAIFAHLYLVWIHPFGDGNGRTARLLEFFILLSGGFPQPTAHLLSNHYNKTRSRYYSSLDGARDGQEGVRAFFEYSLSGFVDGLKLQIEYIREQQWKVAWINYIHEQFADKDSAPDVRRRKLLLALSRSGSSSKVSELRNLSPEIALAYSGKTRKTVIRDINSLIDMDLVYKKSDGSFRAKREKILAFAVWRAGEVGPRIPLPEADAA